MSSPPPDSEIQKFQLRGHRAPVLCLAHSSSLVSSGGRGGTHPAAQCCLLSGSEDGTARLWDLRSSMRAALCIVAPKPAADGSAARGSAEVTSVAFNPLTDAPPDAPVTGGSSHNFTVFLSVGTQVYGYDLRKATSPIVREFDFSLSELFECEDEINQISFSFPTRGGSGKVHLAVADDRGDVKVTDLVPNAAAAGGERSDEIREPHKNRNNCWLLQHAEDEAAMATCAVFRPRAKGLELASGGTDSAVRLWDVTRSRRPSSSFQVQLDSTGANQVCNPPMVHSLSWSPSGRILAAGLGDGTCILLRVEGRRLVEACRLREGHDAAVASVLFPKFGVSSSLHTAAEDRLLVSAGNDGAILLWDLAVDVAGDRAVDPSTCFHGCSINPDIEAGGGMASLSLSSPPKILFGIPHEGKPNWLVSSSCSEPVLPCSLFVADTSFDITAYLLPHR